MNGEEAMPDLPAKVEPFSPEDRQTVFREATRSLVHWYGHRFNMGMTDEELTEALETSLGVFGGSGGPGRVSVTFQGAGLKIWGAWTTVNHVVTPPLVEGAQTIAMAREVYGIADPSNDQLQLL